MLYPIIILQITLNQNSDDSSRSVLVNEIEVPKDVADKLESWLNKAKKVGVVRNNITIIKASGGTSDPKKIMISNMHPEKLTRIEDAVAELMESSDSSDSESHENNLNCLLI